ncbi:MAG TPA: adenylate/guanylate cyclase domain-containing protein [Gaiellaceae bacterium]|nr:adenylate/guanylate cyclase domain-containing protein [Gaiellaceae bacterium]
MTCPSCSRELPGEFPFCPFCGAALAEQPAPSVEEERKVVSVLFCDLVGFTAASEQADPEDVRARIRPYHARLRDEIERFGGTVEKFIGDAVMAVFGAPITYEDDAERAVRAGLRIIEAMAELNEADPTLSLQVRVGINTGEAVVALGARPERGEGIVTGDVVNTASRIQGAAPVNGIAVSEQTYNATERVFDYEPLEAVQVKGKSEPLALWQPLQARARLGADVIRTHTTPLVGRELEKSLLIGTYDRCAQQRACQMVTLVGEPGVGKSRLSAELLAHIEDATELVRWRQGRCLPYGEGIAFWALGEIVKAECGVLESDSPAEAEAKLDRALPEDDPDRAWLKARLAPLLGVSAEPASQEESFTAWRRFLESLAADRPTVLVFEDLHWADDALLSFLEHLADWSQGVPLFLLSTTRPELYEQHPTFGANARNAQRINLGPLTEDETSQLIGSLLERSVLSPETKRALLERSGGNPLYAEEFVRLLADREHVTEMIEVPDSVQALIAARLDTLPAERKSLLQDASVVGKLFWAGAVADMGERDRRDVEFALHELCRKELVRPSRESSMESEQEYGFWHLLVRDVAYAQIPRVARASRHQAAADWLERQAGDRVEDVADVLAYHYLQALELTRAAGGGDDVGELETRAMHYLSLAGERALALDVESAEQSLAQALALCPDGHPERASLLERWAQAAQQQGRLQEARGALEEALALNVDRGRVLTALARVQARLGDPRAEQTVLDALAEFESPGPELVAAHAELAPIRCVAGNYTGAISSAEEALALAKELNLPEPARALNYRGVARAYLGDKEGVDDMRRALALALAHGQGREAAILHHTLAIVSWQYEGPEPALTACQEGIDFCERRGITELALGLVSESLHLLLELGRGDEALAEAEPLAERLQAAGDISFVEPRSLILRLQAERGGTSRAADDLLEAARESGEPQLHAMAFQAASQVLAAQGRADEAKTLLEELNGVEGLRIDPYYAAALPALVRTALAIGDPELAARLVDGVEPRTPLVEHALSACRAELTGDPALYAEAAEGWRAFGNVLEYEHAAHPVGVRLGHTGP